MGRTVLTLNAKNKAEAQAVSKMLQDAIAKCSSSDDEPIGWEAIVTNEGNQPTVTPQVESKENKTTYVNPNDPGTDVLCCMIDNVDKGYNWKFRDWEVIHLDKKVDKDLYYKDKSYADKIETELLELYGAKTGKPFNILSGFRFDFLPVISSYPEDNFEVYTYGGCEQE